MGDRNLTLFALHTHGDTQFGPSSVPGMGSDEESTSDAASKAKSWFGSDADEEAEEQDIEVTDSEEESGGGGIAALVVALVVLAGIAMVARKLSGGEEADIDVAESDEL